MVSEQSSASAPFSPKFIESLRPRDRDFELFDPGAPGLCLRVTPKGSKASAAHST